MEYANSYLQILQSFYNDAQQRYRDYKKDQDDIVRYAGTVFIAIVTVTGICGAYGKTNMISNFIWLHLVMFHLMFFIFYLFYNHKMLCAETYLIASMEAENAIQKFLDLKSYQMPTLVALKGKFIGESDRIRALKHGLSPGKVANVLMLILYFSASLSPYIFFQISVKGQSTIAINSRIEIVLITFGFLLLFWLVNFNIRRRRKSLHSQVRQEVKQKFDALRRKYFDDNNNELRA